MCCMCMQFELLAVFDTSIKEVSPRLNLSGYELYKPQTLLPLSHKECDDPYLKKKPNGYANFVVVKSRRCLGREMGNSLIFINLKVH